MPRTKARKPAITNVSIETVPLDALTPHPENPRQGDVGAISESMTAHGFYGVVVAQRSTSRILAGNHRYLAAQALGLAEIPVAWVEVDDNQARALMLADNRSGDVAGYDTEALTELLRAIEEQGGDLSGTLYTLTDLDELLDTLGAQTPDSGYGHVADGLTAAEREALRDAEGALRMVIFPMAEDDYNETIERLGRVRSILGVETNSEALLSLLRDADAAPDADD